MSLNWMLSFVFCFSLAACVLPSDVVNQRTMQMQQPTEEVRLLALGDSYTIGHGVDEPERWPVQLAARLHQQGIAMADPLIIARTGWTTDELMAGIEARQPVGPFDLVTLLIGVNNQYRQRSARNYREQFRTLLRQAIAFAGADPRRVIVLSIPDWGVTPFAASRNQEEISAEIDLFNAINRAETEQSGARYVDITPISRRAADDPTLLASDQLHPSGRMYTAWVDLILPEAEASLQLGQVD